MPAPQIHSPSATHGSSYILEQRSHHLLRQNRRLHARILREQPDTSVTAFGALSGTPFPLVALGPSTVVMGAISEAIAGQHPLLSWLSVPHAGPLVRFDIHPTTATTIISDTS